MQRLLFLAIIIIMATPSNGARYDEQTYFMAHNAFASSEDGYWYANQKHNIAWQLRLGIRAFMLDVYDNDGRIMLYHGGKWLNRLAQPFKCARTFRSALQEFREFLLEHPEEILTIFLESYITSEQIDAEVEAAGIAELVYKAEGHNPEPEWITLAEMRRLNNRLVIISDRRTYTPEGWWQASKYAFFLNTCVRENQWSNIREPDVLRDIYPLTGQNLYLFNFFPEKGKLWGIWPCDNYDDINDRYLREIMKKVTQKPNFIALNFLERLPDLSTFEWPNVYT